MGTSYDPTTYLNQQATTARSPHAQRPPRGRLRSSPVVGNHGVPNYLLGLRIWDSGDAPKNICFWAAISENLTPIE
jgi:hypothetical protein